MNEKNKKEKKNFFTKLKEAWRNPHKKAGIKLLMYLIFFVVLISLTMISRGINNIEKEYNKVNNKVNDSDNKYVDKQNKILNDKSNINVVIMINDFEYKINGVLENNVISGYFESNDGIKKIIIKNGVMYEIVDNNEIVFNTVIDCSLFDFENMFDVIKNSNAIIENVNGYKNYTYNISRNNNILNVVIYTNSKSIFKIEYKYDNDEYVIHFDN